MESYTMGNDYTDTMYINQLSKLAQNLRYASLGEMLMNVNEYSELKVKIKIKKCDTQII